MSNGSLIVLMALLFLFFGYMGVPVAFALIASVLLITTFTPVSLASMVAQLFNGVDVEADGPAAKLQHLDAGDSGARERVEDRGAAQVQGRSVRSCGVVAIRRDGSCDNATEDGAQTLRPPLVGAGSRTMNLLAPRLLGSDRTEHRGRKLRLQTGPRGHHGSHRRTRLSMTVLASPGPDGR